MAEEDKKSFGIMAVAVGLLVILLSVVVGTSVDYLIGVGGVFAGVGIGAYGAISRVL